MFSSSKKISIEKDLYDRLQQLSEKEGYSSIDEFVVHVLERELKSVEEKSDRAEMEKQLRGLGYIE